MKMVTEIVKFDGEDPGNIDYEGSNYQYGIYRAAKDRMVFLCYYTLDKQNSTDVPGRGKLSTFLSKI